MTGLPSRFIEDLRLRNAARAVLTDDIDRLRETLGEDGIASRVSSGFGSTISERVRTGARDVLSQAKTQAGDHKTVLAVLIGAIMLWFGRGPILDWMDDTDVDQHKDDNHSDAAPDAAATQGDYV
ncbi:hypothetical protein [Erythrobacter sp. R86502]|uniref:hypothetical protein n=1 Tax=Erythrobacter sp. R86502 TaxID=3093846 RepID=UPI0036D3AF7D